MQVHCQVGSMQKPQKQRHIEIIKATFFFVNLMLRQGERRLCEVHLAHKHCEVHLGLRPLSQQAQGHERDP